MYSKCNQTEKNKTLFRRIISTYMEAYLKKTEKPIIPFSFQMPNNDCQKNIIILYILWKFRYQIGCLLKIIEQ